MPISNRCFADRFSFDANLRSISALYCDQPNAAFSSHSIGGPFVPWSLEIMMALHSVDPEAISRSARLRRGTPGPPIGDHLKGVSIVEVMLNPGGCRPIDRSRDGLTHTGERLSAPDGETHCSAGCTSTRWRRSPWQALPHLRARASALRPSGRVANSARFAVAPTPPTETGATRVLVGRPVRDRARGGDRKDN